jgi:hypothetical protein
VMMKCCLSLLAYEAMMVALRSAPVASTHAAFAEQKATLTERMMRSDLAANRDRGERIEI